MGACRGLRDLVLTTPHGLADVISSPENKGGRMGWARLLCSFKLEIHSANHHLNLPLLPWSRGYW